MYYALLVSNRQGVYHAQHQLQAPVALGKPMFPASALFKRMISRLITRLQHN